ncbi:uncharacterized protein LOC114256654 [Camellia sinensis]|uniref:uncharacterized protein LOC114256654 n=1 Tax=Camellia sinensis TaxID=4442 RepID=UPI0010368A8D|nr:uncharacterized protein LOC114256654 [Camellia sinensis]
MTAPATRKDLMIVNMGPHHPSMHGVLRLIVTLDGENVIDCEPILGYLHRGMEKIAENRTIIQYLPYVTRWDYLATMFTEAITVNAPEQLGNIQVPKRASYIRVIMLELSRIASHLLWLGPFMADIGAQTPFFYIFRERELIYDLFEAATGMRMMHNYFRIGGIAADLPHGWIDKCLDFCDYFLRGVAEYQKLITQNPVFLERVEGIGIISDEEAINWGLSGPMLRASGIQWDLRKVDHYECYDEFDWEVQWQKEGDSLARYLVRISEMTESIKIIQQALEGIPGGPYENLEIRRFDRVRNPEWNDFEYRFISKKPSPTFELSKQEIYVRVEAPKGELGIFLIGDQSVFPGRWKIRPPGFVNLQILPQLVKRMKLADIMTILGIQAINSFSRLESLKEVYGIIWMFVPILTLVLGITIGVLVIVWLEREISAGIQQRIGPEYAGPLGILQALADGTKLLFKENILPSRGDTRLFSIGPSIAVISILLSYSIIPFGYRLILADLSIGVFLWIAISSIAPVGLLMSGYGSNNKYSFLGGLRAAAQSISYEIPLTLCVLSISLLSNSSSTVDIVEAQSKYGFWGWNLWRQPIGFIVFLISSLAECERLPFDLPEAEEELVAGYQTEYSGIKFGLFYVASYLNLLVSSLFVTVLYLGGWNISIPYIFFPELFEINKAGRVFGTIIGIFITLAKTYLFLFISITTRWTLPRLRMDQLLNLGWKFLLPISLEKKTNRKFFIDIYDMFPMVTGFMNYSQQTVRAARYIGQSFIITLSHANRLPVTIQYPYEKWITSERFRGRIHFEFDKCIACEVCVRVCPIDLPVVDWKLETDIRKKRLLNYSIDFGICIFCGNCVEYYPTNCLSMTEEYELSTYDRHELNYNQIALGRLPMSVIEDYTIRTILNSPQIKNG